MEIRRLQCYMIINFALIYYSETKTFSLNEAIAAESQQRLLKTPLHEEKDNTVLSRHDSAKKFLTPGSLKLRKSLEQANTLQASQKISPLKYRKAFQINSPLKPRKVKFPINSRLKRKNQSVKREINGNEKLKQKYIPFLKSLSMLFDNLLNSDTSESHEIKRNKYKRNRYYYNSKEVSGDGCACAQETDGKIEGSRPQEKAVTSAPPSPAEISTDSEDIVIAETTPASTNYPSSRNISRLRQHKNVSILFPRNTFSARRNYNGIGERSGTTHNRNPKGNITGDNGDRKHITRFRKIESNTESDEENTDGASRNDASSNGSIGNGRIRGDGNNTRNSKNRTTADEIAVSENESADDSIRENKFEIGRNKTKGTKPISESIRRLRGFVPEKENCDVSESIQSEEVLKESDVYVTYDNANDKSIIGRSGASAAKDQTVRTRDETVAQYTTTTSPQQQQDKTPLLMIFDGYSVTRDKNGENKLAEKSIRIHS